MAIALDWGTVRVSNPQPCSRQQHPGSSTGWLGRAPIRPWEGFGRSGAVSPEKGHHVSYGTAVSTSITTTTTTTATATTTILRSAHRQWPVCPQQDRVQFAVAQDLPSLLGSYVLDSIDRGLFWCLTATWEPGPAGGALVASGRLPRKPGHPWGSGLRSSPCIAPSLVLAAFQVPSKLGPCVDPGTSRIR
ncbi:hypothetical protein J1614_010143 [Plenodomus biglobosus]|nr:hypothetical protein J1614_010143 [Plenodomus biglobosus]